MQVVLFYSHILQNVCKNNWNVHIYFVQNDTWLFIGNKGGYLYICLNIAKLCFYNLSKL